MGSETKSFKGRRSGDSMSSLKIKITSLGESGGRVEGNQGKPGASLRREPDRVSNGTSSQCATR